MAKLLSIRKGPLFALLTSFALSLTTAGAQAPTYPVRGTVVNSLTRQPIARALVECGSQNQLTDGDGHFELALPVGSSTLNVVRPGFESRHPFYVTVAADTPSITVPIVPLASISGQVTLSTGDDPSDITVNVRHLGAPAGRNQWENVAPVRTGPDGTFHLSDLEAGSYVLFTSALPDSPAGAKAGAESWGYAAAYYPEASEADLSAVITLRPGEQGEADFSLVRQRFYPVTISAGGEESGRPSFRLEDSSGRELGLPMHWNSESRQLILNAPPGNYVIEAIAGGRERLYGSLQFTVREAAVAGLHLSLLPIQPIQIEVHKAPEAAINVNNQTATPIRWTYVRFIPIDLPFSDAHRGATPSNTSELVAAGQNMRMENAPPGRYWVVAFDEGSYISSITSGTSDLVREPINVSAGGTPPIEVTFRDDSGMIQGHIRNWQPESAAGLHPRTRIYAVPLFPRSGMVNQGQIENDGSFVIGRNAPGEYRVIALDEPLQMDLHSPEALASISQMGAAVTVEPGGTASVELDGPSTPVEAEQ